MRASAFVYLVLIFMPFACSLPPRPETAESASDLYYVEEVTDGDTFVLKDGEKVRLIGIDAPETPQSYKQRNFHYGIEARDYLEELIESRRVKLEFDREKRDRYGRLLAYVWLESGLFINAHLIREGYARVVTFPPNVKYHDELIRFEDEARKAKRGLWKK